MILKAFLMAEGLALTAGIYYPLFKRILTRKHTKDFSKLSSWFVFLTQVNNIIFAMAEHAHFLTVWYVIQSLLCGFQLTLIYKYYNTARPE